MISPKLAFIGSTHQAPAWLIHAIRKHGTLEAVCDESPRRDADVFQARWIYSNVDDLLREAEPSGVIVLRPCRERYGIIKQCLGSGASVLIPGIPCALARWDRLATMSKLAGRTVLSASPARFAPGVSVARRLIESGKFGTPMSLALHITRRGAPREGLDDQGPVAADQVFEAADLVQTLIGSIREVTSAAHQEGTMMVVGRTTADTPFCLELHASGPPETLGLELELRSVDGTCMRIEKSGQLFCSNGSRVDAMYRPTLATSDPAVELGYDGLVGEFVRWVVAGGAVPADSTPFETVIAASEAILSSARSGHKVSVKRRPPVFIDRRAAVEPARPVG
jgi:predicted dehydrogenase